jgi:hypothetical protein
MVVKEIPTKWQLSFVLPSISGQRFGHAGVTVPAQVTSSMFRVPQTGFKYKDRQYMEGYSNCAVSG